MGLSVKTDEFRAVPKRLSAWFSGLKHIRFDLGLKHFKPLYSKSDTARSHVFSGRSVYIAPVKFSTVVHEMAHMIEIDDKRAHLSDFGMSYRKVKFLGKTYYEPQTDQACQREIRVFAIEAAILEHMGFVVDYDDRARILLCGALSDDFYWRKTLGLEYKQKEEFQNETASVIRSLRESLNIEDLWTEWVRKCRIVDQRFQRKNRKNGSTT